LNWQILLPTFPPNLARLVCGRLLFERQRPRQPEKREIDCNVVGVRILLAQIEFIGAIFWLQEGPASCMPSENGGLPKFSGLPGE
jgi:hypothetical protein